MELSSVELGSAQSQFGVQEAELEKLKKKR